MAIAPPPPPPPPLRAVPAAPLIPPPPPPPAPMTSTRTPVVSAPLVQVPLAVKRVKIAVLPPPPPAYLPIIFSYIPNAILICANHPFCTSHHSIYPYVAVDAAL